MRRRSATGRRLRLIGLVAKPTSGAARQVVPEVVRCLERSGVTVRLDSEAAQLAGRPHGLERIAVARGADAVVVIGGDGTFLAAARAVGRTGPPLVGINLGSLGFLTEVDRSEIEAGLEIVVRGKAVEERRLMLEAVLLRDGRRRSGYAALNDIVVTKGSLARLVPVEVEVDGQRVTTFRGDGVIVASPTGSTAYSLSAGGPLVHPAMNALLLTPVCPHTLTNRPLVLPATSVITLTHPIVEEPLHLTVDGQLGGHFAAGEQLVVKRSRVTLRVLRPFPRSFYETLRSKLKWG